MLELMSTVMLIKLSLYVQNMLTRLNFTSVERVLGIKIMPPPIRDTDGYLYIARVPGSGILDIVTQW